MDKDQLKEFTGFTPITSVEPNFINNTFEEKLTNGWLKYYNLGIIAYSVFTLLNVILQFQYCLSLVNYDIWFSFGYLLSGFILMILLQSLFYQYQALKFRSLPKQISAIRMAQLHIIASFVFSLIAGIFIFRGYFAYLASLISGSLFAVFYLFLAVNVKKIMLGKDDESFRFDKTAFLI